MELLLAVGSLVLLAILALLVGYDSRDGLQSKEAELACFGMDWGGGAPVPLKRPPVARRRLRRALARALFALADWLSPGLPAARTS